MRPKKDKKQDKRYKIRDKTRVRYSTDKTAGKVTETTHDEMKPEKRGKSNRR